MLDIVVKIVLGTVCIALLCGVVFGLVLMMDWYDHRSPKTKTRVVILNLIVVGTFIAYLIGDFAVFLASK